MDIESISDNMNQQKTMLTRIQYVFNQIGDKEKNLPKVAEYSGLEPTKIRRYLDGRHQMPLEDIGLLIMALIRRLNEINQPKSPGPSMNIEAFCIGLDQNELRQNLRVAGEHALIREVSRKIPTSPDEDHESFENVDYAKGLIRQWEEKTTGNRYIKDVYRPLQLKKSQQTADDMLLQWIKKPGSGFMLLLGDIGIGKTTTLLHFIYQLAMRHVENPRREPLPIQIDLKRFREVNDIQTLIESILFNHFRDKITDMDHLLRLAESGRIVFVLDGFDEMAIRLSKNKLFEHLIQIERLFHEKGKLVLSSRKQVFSSQEEVINLFNQTKLKVGTDAAGNAPPELAGFTLDDIRIYVQRYYSEDNYQELLGQLENLPDFEKMCWHPMMLEMMVQVIPELKGTPDLTKGAIFTKYYDLWSGRKRNGRLIDPENLKKFCQVLAGSQWRLNELRMSYTRLKEEVRKHFNPEDPKEFENLTRAISNDSFLTRDGDQWAFMHESFFHYFLALAIAEREPDIRILQCKPLIPEVLDFIKGLEIESGWFTQHDTDIKARGGPITNFEKNLSANCMAILEKKGFNTYLWDQLTPALKKKIDSVKGLTEMANGILHLVKNSSTCLSDIVNVFITEKTKFSGLAGLTSAQVHKTFMMLSEFQALNYDSANAPVSATEFEHFVLSDPDMRYVKGLVPFLQDCSAIVNIQNIQDEKPVLSFVKDYLFHYFQARAIYERIKNNHIAGMGASPVQGETLEWFFDMVSENELNTTLSKILKYYIEKSGDAAWRETAGEYMGSICLSIYSWAKFDLSELSLAGGHFPKSYLRDGNFAYSDMTGINLSDSNLSNTGLRKCKLIGANLTNVDFTDAAMTRAVCRKANLSYAQFSRAHLDHVDFSGCDLTGVDLSNVASKTRIIVDKTTAQQGRGV